MGGCSGLGCLADLGAWLLAGWLLVAAGSWTVVIGTGLSWDTLFFLHVVSQACFLMCSKSSKKVSSNM